MVDFGPDDFVISEAGREREVLDVHIADYPVAVLLDDGASGENWSTIRSAAIRFINRIGERPVMVQPLSGVGEIAALDVERGDALDRLSAFRPTLGAQRTALPAISAASTALSATGSPFSAIVIVAAAPVDATEQVRSDLLPLILESGAVVHVVEARGTASPAADLLRVMADQTHGQYTTIFAAASYSIALDRLADRLAAEMMVQYLVPPGDRIGDVKIGVRRPGARVLGLGVSK